MGRMAKSISANEILEILNKQWLSTQDIKLLAGTGISKAYKIKDEITNKLLEDNYYLPPGKLPTDQVIDYLKINVSYLKKVANTQNRS